MMTDITKSNQLIEELESIRYALSHPFRDPLNIAINECEKLMKNESIDIYSKHKVEYIKLSLDKLSHDIDSLNEYSFLFMKGRNKSEQIDLNEMLQDVLKMLENHINSRNAQIEVSKLPIIEGSKKHITRLFYHLLENAIKFCEETPIIRLSAENNGDMWQFALEDNGIGINPIYAKIIYRPFQKLNPENSLSNPGMGLAFSKLIVEQHQGKLWFEENHNRNGTIFYFTLSAKEASSPRG